MMTMLARIGLIFILGCVICSSADEVQSSNKDDTIYMHATKALPGGIGDIVTEHESGSTTDDAHRLQCFQKYNAPADKTNAIGDEIDRYDCATSCANGDNNKNLTKCSELINPNPSESLKTECHKKFHIFKDPNTNDKNSIEYRRWKCVNMCIARNESEAAIKECTPLKNLTFDGSELDRTGQQPDPTVTEKLEISGDRMDDCRKKFHFNDTSPDHDQRWSCVQKCAKNETTDSKECKSFENAGSNLAPSITIFIFGILYIFSSI